MRYRCARRGFVGGLGFTVGDSSVGYQARAHSNKPVCHLHTMVGLFMHRRQQRLQRRGERGRTSRRRDGLAGYTEEHGYQGVQQHVGAHVLVGKCLYVRAFQTIRAELREDNVVRGS